MKRLLATLALTLIIHAGALAQVAGGPISGGGGSAGIGGSTGATDNAILRADGVGGVTAQGSPLTLSDVSGVTTTLATITPAATTGATVAGQALAITASPAVASTDTAGAAAGGTVTISAGDAARLTSGNAKGGDIVLDTGAGIGTGTAGQVLGPAGTEAAPAFSFSAGPTTGMYGSSTELQFSVGGFRKFYVTEFTLWVQSNLLGFGGVFTGFRMNIEANTAGSGSPNILASFQSMLLSTNEGTTVANYHTLPTATTGYNYRFCVQDADGMRLTANTSDTIRVIDKVTAAAGYIESTTIGSCVELVAINAVEWFAVSIHGTWTDGTWSYDDTSLTTP